MDRKALTAKLMGFEPEELLGFKDYGDHTAAIAPDGRKFIYTDDELKAAEEKLKPPPKPKPTRKPAARKKPPAKSTRGQASAKS